MGRENTLRVKIIPYQRLTISRVIVRFITFLIETSESPNLISFVILSLMQYEL